MLHVNKYIKYKENKNLLQILIGDDSVYTEIKDLCETWYHMLVSKMLYQRPTVKSIDLHYYVQVIIL